MGEGRWPAATEAVGAKEVAASVGDLVAAPNMARRCPSADEDDDAKDLSCFRRGKARSIGVREGKGKVTLIGEAERRGKARETTTRHGLTTGQTSLLVLGASGRLHHASLINGRKARKGTRFG
ncbi:hypothetical protein [Oryza sativa Japonica Group]|uniref:Uncharacterized protein n=2 Tax=Oryza sativa subsp. japonica TaxID=39947 RepID=Q5ZBT5_ORYSJ|nr:hypothetical protein [Oryza sativa Japonica Group]BAD53009.1 hypothetical protein [Oryza sativa Japonica Group]